MIECACANCNHRVVGCHATCEEYKDFVKRKDEKRKNLYNLKVEERSKYRVTGTKKYKR